MKAARQERRITQETLADRIERSVDAISNVERGLSLPSHETMRRLSNELAIPIAVLLEWLANDSAGEQENVEVDDERICLEARLAVLTNSLETRHLRLAVEQIRVLVEFFSTGSTGP